MHTKRGLFLIALIVCIFIQSIVFAQDTQYQPLISGIGQYEKALHYLEKAKTKDKTIESLTLYYTGLARQQLGRTNIYFDEKRKDIERSVNVAFSKDISKGWIVSLEYLHRRNSSNIALYDYKKNLYSMGVSWRW